SRRLTEKTASEICDLIYTPRLASFKSTLPYLTEINEAHLLMLSKQKILDPDVSAQLAAAILRIEKDGADSIELDPEREDSYFNYEARLIAITAPAVGGRLHTARSRNDILATIGSLVARDIVIPLLDALGSWREVVLERAARYVNTVMPGYTHLQPAQPITYGFY